jgi:hypothetical protein
MQSQPTELHLKNAEHVIVYVNDKVVGECVLGHFEGADDLMERVRHARRLEAVPQFIAGLIDRLRTIPNIEDHVNATPAAKQQAFARGLLDGLAMKSEPCFAFPGVNPNHPPEHTHAYRAGYSYGESLATVNRLLAHAYRAKSPTPTAEER